LFVAALGLGVAAPAAALAGLDTFDVLGTSAVAVVGVALAALGIAGTLWAQLAMGDSWRIGVETAERTDLVTGGLFGLIRNPIFTTMGVTAVGLALMVPNAVAVVGLIVLLIALELQVRVVEEPYLLSIHGDAFARYASEVGRFLPALGRIDASHMRSRREPQTPS
jgi:protein-S-isoprenylcysteine O-methyltransferase Ste14